MAAKASIFRLRLVGAVLVLGALALATRFFDLPRCGDIVAYFDAMDWHASVCFFLAFVVATVALLPGIILTLVAGMAFGAWQGFAIVVASAMAGITLTFIITRHLARDRVEKLLSEKRWFRKLKSGLRHSGLSAVLMTRLVPFFPYNGLNYALGLFPLRTRDYLLGSLIGMAPGILTYTYIGALIGCAYLDAKPTLDPQTATILAGLVGIRALLAAGAFFLWRAARRRNESVAEIARD